MKIPQPRRVGISGIIGAVFFFVMLFTVGTGYLISVNNANTLYLKNFGSSNSQLASRLSENVIIVTNALSNGHIGFYFNNTGGVAINVSSAFLMDSSGNILACLGIGLPSGQSCTNTTPALPGLANPGKGTPATGYFDTGYTYVSGTDTLKLVTQRGNIFSATYPLTPVPLASLAVTTQGAGLIQINFNSYVYYNTVSNCNPTNTGCQLTPWPSGTSAYSMPSYVTQGNIYYVYAVSVQNVDPQKRTITLDSNCVFNQYQVPTGGGSNGKNYAWKIGSVSSSGVTQAFSSITLTSNQVATLYFTVIPGTSAASWPVAGNFVAIFMFLHGTVGSSNFGQNVPFVTTLYN